MDEQGLLWLKCENPDLAFHEWNGERVYHSARSGDTHLVTTFDLLILKELEQGPIGSAQIDIQTGDLDDQESAEMAVSESLDRLHRLGLAARLLP